MGTTNGTKWGRGGEVAKTHLGSGGLNLEEVQPSPLCLLEGTLPKGGVHGIIKMLTELRFTQTEVAKPRRKHKSNPCRRGHGLMLKTRKVKTQ